jgi:N-acetylneuraminic acid mutarotase
MAAMLTLLILIAGATLPLQGQSESADRQVPAVTHDTWTSGAALPTAVASAAAAVLKKEIYLVGGNDATEVVADVQIYNPATNTWSTGVSYPVIISGASAAVVKNVLYVFGGSQGEGLPTNAVYAFNPKTKTWTAMANMPTARWLTAAVVEKNIIYVIGGIASPTDYLATVESYNPATNTWTEETPLLEDTQGPAAGLLGTTIMVTDGANQPGQITGASMGYDATNNTWERLAVDPEARVLSCYGSIGANFYDAGGYLNNAGPATTVNESFNLSKGYGQGLWTTTLAPMPQGIFDGSSAVYNKQLYCIGGFAYWNGTPINNVQIYQP